MFEELPAEVNIDLPPMVSIMWKRRLTSWLHKGTLAGAFLCSSIFLPGALAFRMGIAVASVAVVLVTEVPVIISLNMLWRPMTRRWLRRALWIQNTELWVGYGRAARAYNLSGCQWRLAKSLRDDVGEPLLPSLEVIVVRLRTKTPACGVVLAICGFSEESRMKWRDVTGTQWDE